MSGSATDRRLATAVDIHVDPEVVRVRPSDGRELSTGPSRPPASPSPRRAEQRGRALDHAVRGVHDRVVPSSEDVRGRQWEQAIRGDYARPAFLVGQQYEVAKQYAEARIWYTRALAIDPQFQRARDALTRLPRS